MMKKNVKVFRPRKSRNLMILTKLKGNFSTISLRFRNHDNSIRTMETNPKFFTSESGDRLEPHDIIKNINALKHDLNAKDVQIVY